MTQLRDMATVTVRGENSDIGTDLTAAAHLVWRAVRRDATVHAEGGPLVYTGSLTQVIYGLWPELSGADNRAISDAFRRDVYRALRETGNAYCSNRGSKRQGDSTRWVIADTWLGPTSGGREFTAVATATWEHTAVKPDDHSVKSARVLTGLASQAAADHKARLDMVADLLASTAQPLTSKEVAAVMEVHTTTAKSLLVKLVETGRAYTREETKAERRLRRHGTAGARHCALYSSVTPVPPRTSADAVDEYHERPAATATVRAARGTSIARMLAAVGTTYTSGPNIARRAGLPPGSAYYSMKRLEELGKVEAKTKRRGKHEFKVYRLAPATGPVTSLPAPALVKSEAVTIATQIQAVVDENARLKAENADLREQLARFAALSDALSGLNLGTTR